MRSRSLLIVFALFLLVTFLFTGRGGPGFKTTAQKAPVPQVTPVNNARVASKSPQAEVTPNPNTQVAPAKPGKAVKPNAVTSTVRLPVERGFFRVTLNGFRVNHESDDDILEGDGRGDEVFITTNNWILQKDGTYQSLRQSRTKVMGDPNGHPERIAAGSGHPGPLSLENLLPGGLRSGDSFPSNEPWRRTREPMSDRPPVVLWNGYLTQGEDMVVIAPIVWEWDSDEISVSQDGVTSGLPVWFERLKTNLMPHLVNWDLGSRVNFDPCPIRLNGKAGTRPIGYREAGTTPGPNGTDSYDYLGIVGLYLTYDSAIQAANKVELGARGLYQLHYIDASDNGYYTLYLQVERMDRV
jgi:hypothetical protein